MAEQQVKVKMTALYTLALVQLLVSVSGVVFLQLFLSPSTLDLWLLSMDSHDIKLVPVHCVIESRDRETLQLRHGSSHRADSIT